MIASTGTACALRRLSFRTAVRESFGRLVFATTVAFAALLFAQPCNAVPFTQGNLLVSTGWEVDEYTRSGGLVQRIPVPIPNATQYQFVGGIVMDSHGKLEVANYEAFGDSYLSVYDPMSDTWQHALYPGAGQNGISSLAAGALLRYGDFVYIQNGSNDSLYRFNVVDLSSSPVPLLQGTMAFGLDHLRYDGSTFVFPGDHISVYDPVDSHWIRDVQLMFPQNIYPSFSGMAVDKSGNIFIADGAHSEIFKFLPNGALVGQISTGRQTGYLTCLAIDPSGTTLVASQDGRGGDVTITDTNLSSAFVIQSAGAYVNFVIPEPSGFVLGALGLICLVSWVGRRKR